MGGTKIHKPSIFQMKLQFPASRADFALDSEHPFERVAFNTFLAVLTLLVFSYIYLVSSSALNIIARKEALAQSAQVGSSIGTYEREYFAVSRKVTPEAGTILGLAPVSKTAYVFRPGTVGQAKVAHNEI
ncbi:hypothetical protein A3C86_02565 [Candidatus Kaiserbacteria bacterium RIFCSPHIGHO2_02_FULL_49_16]|uniref:Uncharacterized protein n=1 Tax=Candidatus Kaiserbacteria bacterium RIFCSPHIGHO2_02_FULL_49_16 TaxID=1798490 RepID=A0A1F6DC61_9BACT|nr:MAG: hypothetical protein A3C86_02565 [Candidatus Kaiserbacteria bacterium RIFCSPHIGHO2_02_FULL_49_16]